MSITEQRTGMPATQRPSPVRRDHRVSLLGGRATARYRRRGRWAITAAGVQACPSDRELALSSYLDVLRAEHLLPLFVDVADPPPFARRGLDVHRYATEAVLDAARFTLTSPGRRELARDVIEARDRLVVLPGPRDTPASETWTAVDTDGTVQGSATWSPGGSDGGWSLAGITAHRRAPVGTVELLIADAVAEYRDRGVDRLGLGRRCRGWWSGDGGVLTDDVRAVVERFAPHWQPRWLALHSLWQLPAAAVAMRPGSVA